MDAAKAGRYRLLAGALPAEEKRIRSSYAPTLVLVLALGFGIALFAGTRHGATSRSSIELALFAVVYLAYVSVWAPRRMKRRLVKCWDTYELEIGPDYLCRRQADVAELCLRFDEIKAIEHVPGRYLRVISNPKTRVIGIPEGIEDFNEISETISRIKPVRIVHTQQWQKYMAFMAAAMILFVATLWSTSPLLVIPLALGTSALIIWALSWCQRNPNLSRNSKRMAWLYLLFVGICIFKLLGTVGPYLSHPTGR